MTRTRRALRLSPLAFALAFGAYSENFTANLDATLAPEARETAALAADDGKVAPGKTDAQA